MRDIRNKLRRKSAIKLLREGIEPRDIMEYKFKMYVGESNWIRFFTKLFDIPYEEILRKYSR